MGKALQVVLAEYTVKDAASASLTNIYRKNQQVNKSLQQGEQQAKKTQKSLEAMSKGIKGIGDNVKRMGGGASGSLQSAMTSGGSGMIQKIPGLGAIFGAAQSAVESAAQEFVAGISTTKNVRLLETNFSMALGKGADKAFKGSIFRSRDVKGAMTGMSDMGVDSSLLQKNAGLLEGFAKSQGHGSMQEAMAALTSGNVKQGRGLTKSEVDQISAYKELFASAHTASTGLELIAGVLKQAEDRTKKFTAAMDEPTYYKGKGGKMVRGASTSDLIRTEGNVQDTEESYQMSAAAALAGSYGPMNSGRLADLKVRAKAAPLARKMQKLQTGATEVALETFDELASGNTGGKQVPQILLEKAYNKLTGKSEEGPGNAQGGPVAAGEMYTVGEHGREQFIPNSNGRIVSSQSMKNMGGAKVTIHNHITVPMQGFADMLERETMKAMNKVGRSILPLHLGVQPRV